MGIFAALKAIFTGSGAVKSIENIASEWIETDLESAEAKVLMVKTLDPNGSMRRDLSNRVTTLYTIYLIVSMLLLSLEFFGYGNAEAVADVTAKLVSLFLPISTLFGLIVSASFGVNYKNSQGGK
jgi:hypothetical protein